MGGRRGKDERVKGKNRRKMKERGESVSGRDGE